MKGLFCWVNFAVVFRVGLSWQRWGLYFGCPPNIHVFRETRRWYDHLKRLVADARLTQVHMLTAKLILASHQRRAWGTKVWKWKRNELRQRLSGCNGPYIYIYIYMYVVIYWNVCILNIYYFNVVNLQSYVLSVVFKDILTYIFPGRSSHLHAYRMIPSISSKQQTFYAMLFFVEDTFAIGNDI